MTTSRPSAIDPAELVGLAEIAIRAGTTNATVANWAKRHADFPAPVRNLICGPVYAWPQVAAWLDEHDMPNASYDRGLSDVAAMAITQAADRIPSALWPKVAEEYGVSARTVQLVVQAREVGEDYGWYTRQRRQAAGA